MRQSIEKEASKRVVARPDVMVRGYKFTCDSGNVNSMFNKKQRRMKNKLKAENKILGTIKEAEWLS